MDGVQRVLSTGEKKMLAEYLGGLATARYLLVRMETVPVFYDGQKTLDGMASTVFLLAYARLFSSLKAGDTWLWLEDGETDGLATWQMTMTADVREFVRLVMGEDVPLVTLFKNLLVHPDAQTETVNAYCQELFERALFGGLERSYAQALSELCRLACRFFYGIAKKRLHQAAQFHAYISDLPFVITKNTADGAMYRRFLVLGELKADAGFGLWLYRSFYAEWRLANVLKARIKDAVQPPAVLPETLPEGLNTAQKQAVMAALGSRFSIITGGPGTGKTHTVGELVKLLVKGDKAVSLALTAPTGKAAKRMQESLQKTLSGTNIELPDAMTIHRLLGIGLDGVPRYHEKNPLPFKVVIVDEASMLGVELAYQLISAVAKDGQLILLGDVHQLAAVEAGAVLGDLCRAEILKPYHQTLTESRRFDAQSGIGRLAAVVNAGGEQALMAERLFSVIEAYADLAFYEVGKPSDDNKTALYAKLIGGYEPYFKAVQNLKAYFKSVTDEAQRLSEVKDVFHALNSYRVLCASHQGWLGDTLINEKISTAHLSHQLSGRAFRAVPTWYHGRVLMMTKNAYELGLFNGDVGICVQADAGFLVYFDGKETPVPAAMLPTDAVVDGYAMTVHKSQGSEFQDVAVCFDESNEALLGRELLYTAITRAKETVTIYSTRTALVSASLKPSVRETGLGALF